MAFRILTAAALAAILSLAGPGRGVGETVPDWFAPLVPALLNGLPQMDFDTHAPEMSGAPEPEAADAAREIRRRVGYAAGLRMIAECAKPRREFDRERAYYSDALIGALFNAGPVGFLSTGPNMRILAQVFRPYVDPGLDLTEQLQVVAVEAGRQGPFIVEPGTETGTKGKHGEQLQRRWKEHALLQFLRQEPARGAQADRRADGVHLR